MRSSNPSLNDKTFSRFRGSASSGNAMTIGGAVNKTFILLVVLMGSAFYSWNEYFSGNMVQHLLWIGVLGGLVMALITAFVPRISPFTAPAYALLEGLAIGALSAIYESQFRGITLQAALLTISTLLAMLLLYKTGIIKVTKNFRIGVISATMGIFFVYLIDIILRFFGMNVPFLHETGMIGIIISLVIVGVAALNLVLDFDFIEAGARQQVPKYMEWYAGFGLLVTLVWLYIEMLRLLSKIRRN
ncbi:Bax inhibitor-1/YccA family protein [Pseudalkalibacillus sp. R45]|uniref:Bax inhibitor-1/YccA family protein n=1 Tax=Pseudalkalibacillus sp. R45 TaxID=3457433 RepID=UPI003FCD6E73